MKGKQPQTHFELGLLSLFPMTIIKTRRKETSNTLIIKREYNINLSLCLYMRKFHRHLIETILSEYFLQYCLILINFSMILCLTFPFFSLFTYPGLMSVHKENYLNICFPLSAFFFSLFLSLSSFLSLPLSKKDSFLKVFHDFSSLTKFSIDFH